MWGPLAVGRPNRVVAANSGSWCIGLLSPAAFANSTTIAGESAISREKRSLGKAPTTFLPVMFMTPNGALQPRRARSLDFLQDHTCAIGCKRRLGRLLAMAPVIRTSHGDNDLSSAVTFLQIPESVRDFAQRERSVDDRRELAGLDELLHEQQVLLVRRCRERPQVLAHER